MEMEVMERQLMCSPPTLNAGEPRTRHSDFSTISRRHADLPHVCPHPVHIAGEHFE
jgi:hypothetical protein